MSIPLYLTLGRVLLAPLFTALYLYPHFFGMTPRMMPYALLTVLILSELSDIFDGFFARRKNIVTDLGKLLDPMADSIVRLSVFFTFTQGVVGLPLLLALTFFYREMIIITLRSLCALRGVALAARISGKVKAVLQAIAGFFMTLLLIPHSRGSLSEETVQFYSLICTTLVLIYTLYTGFEYIVSNRNYIKRALLKS